MWSIDPIFSAATKDIHQYINRPEYADHEKIQGLFGDAVRWLLKNVGVKAIDWLSAEAKKYINKGPLELDYGEHDEEDDSREEEKSSFYYD